MSEKYSALFKVKKVNIRGIGSEELVCVLKSEFNNLEIDDKEKFKPI